MEQLAAFTGAGVPPCFTGLWIAEQSHELRGDVLIAKQAGQKWMIEGRYGHGMGFNQMSKKTVSCGPCK